MLFAASGGEKNLGHALTAKRGYQFTVVVKRAVIENTLHEEGIADGVLLVFGRVPEEVSMLVYYLFARPIKALVAFAYFSSMCEITLFSLEKQIFARFLLSGIKTHLNLKCHCLAIIPQPSSLWVSFRL